MNDKDLRHAYLLEPYYQGPESRIDPLKIIDMIVMFAAPRAATYAFWRHSDIAYASRTAAGFRGVFSDHSVGSVSTAELGLRFVRSAALDQPWDIAIVLADASGEWLLDQHDGYPHRLRLTALEYDELLTHLEEQGFPPDLYYEASHAIVSTIETVRAGIRIRAQTQYSPRMFELAQAGEGSQPIGGRDLPEVVAETAAEFLAAVSKWRAKLDDEGDLPVDERSLLEEAATAAEQLLRSDYGPNAGV